MKTLMSRIPILMLALALLVSFIVPIQSYVTGFAVADTPAYSQQLSPVQTIVFLNEDTITFVALASITVVMAGLSFMTMRKTLKHLVTGIMAAFGLVSGDRVDPGRQLFTKLLFKFSKVLPARSNVTIDAFAVLFKRLYSKALTVGAFASSKTYSKALTPAAFA